MRKKTITLLLAAALLLALLAGCGGTQETPSDQPAESQEQETPANTQEQPGQAPEETPQVRKITAVTGGNPRPYIWQNEDGTLDGYDIAVFNAIMDRLPQYELEYLVTGANDIFTTADAGYAQVIVQHLATNEERQAKYLFSLPYYFAEHGLLVPEGSELRTWDDLIGHSTEVNPSSFNSLLFEKWNADNPDRQIELVYVDDPNTTPLHVADGTVDFEFFDYMSLKAQVEAQGLTGLELYPIDNDSIPSKGVGYTYFVFPKSEQQLQEDVDAAFQELLEEGVIDELSQQYLDGDFAPTLEEAQANR